MDTSQIVLLVIFLVTVVVILEIAVAEWHRNQTRAHRDAERRAKHEDARRADQLLEAQWFAERRSVREQIALVEQAQRRAFEARAAEDVIEQARYNPDAEDQQARGA